jgi:cellulose synthase/poly-beta-1,6-N-acetylglucosamine synthase-like glycosyltransferase
MRREQAPEGWGGHSDGAPPKLSIIVPVDNGAATLPACLKALIEAPGPSREIIVSDDASHDQSAEIASAMGMTTLRSDVNRGASAARNAGASEARAQILVFVDCDVVIHADALTRIEGFFDENPQYAALFGSYDAKPTSENFVSQYRNLLHHFTHQSGNFEAETFWTGLGAIRRSAFEYAKGFREEQRSVEDIELGLRLSSDGFQIALDPSLTCTHLKAWTLFEMAKTDLCHRALPWSSLLLERARLTKDLNTNANGRLGVASVFLATTSLLLAAAWPGFGFVAVAATISMLASIRPLLQHLRRERGALFAVRSVPVHFIHLLCASIGFLMALLRHMVRGLPSSHGQRDWSRPIEARRGHGESGQLGACLEASHNGRSKSDRGIVRLT